MSRLRAIVAAALACAGLALTSSAGAQTGAAPAHTVHAGTRLNFPPSLGGAIYEQGQNQGTTATYMYAANKMQIYVYVFNDDRRIPPGSETPALMAEFASDLDQTAAQLKTAGYGQIERPAVPSTCTYGTITFRCIAYSVSSTGGRLYSKMLMTGYHDYFLKIRIDWAQATGQSQADADKALESFIPALVH